MFIFFILNGFDCVKRLFFWKRQIHQKRAQPIPIDSNPMRSFYKLKEMMYSLAFTSNWIVSQTSTFQSNYLAELFISCGWCGCFWKSDYIGLCWLAKFQQHSNHLSWLNMWNLLSSWKQTNLNFLYIIKKCTKRQSAWTKHI